MAAVDFFSRNLSTYQPNNSCPVITFHVRNSTIPTRRMWFLAINSSQSEAFKNLTLSSKSLQCCATLLFLIIRETLESKRQYCRFIQKHVVKMQAHSECPSIEVSDAIVTAVTLPGSMVIFGRAKIWDFICALTEPEMTFC
jgi:hypothetical protein